MSSWRLLSSSLFVATAEPLAEFASLHYTLDTSKMDPQVARQAMLFVQMFVVKAPAARGKQKLE